MRISENGVELIKRFEGLELESYQDIAGVWTIGYGHTETAGPNQKISEREAEALLRRDLESRERAVNNLASVPLNQNEFDALVSFVYNVGAEAFKGSTARKRLNRNDRVGAADALTWWNKATVKGVLREVLGLTRRRAAERALFLTPVNPPIVNNPNNVAENSRATPVEEAPRRETLGDSRTIQGAVVAGGAGATASTIGKDSAEELDKLETNIEDGASLTEKPASEGGLRGDLPGDQPDAGGPDTPPPDSGTPSDGAPTDGTPPDGTPTDGAPTDGTPATGDGTAPDGATPDARAPDAGAPDSGAPDAGTTPDTGETPTSPSDGGSAGGELNETIEVAPHRPSKHEKHAVDAQLQLALLIIIVLSAIYIAFARVDDWFKFRR